MSCQTEQAQTELPTRRRASTRLGDRYAFHGRRWAYRPATSLDSNRLDFLLACSVIPGSPARALPTTVFTRQTSHDSYYIYRMWVGGRNREAQAGHSSSQSWLLQLRHHSVPGDFPTLPPILLGSLHHPKNLESANRFLPLLVVKVEGSLVMRYNPHHPTLSLTRVRGRIFAFTHYEDGRKEKVLVVRIVLVVVSVVPVCKHVMAVCRHTNMIVPNTIYI